ncbi:MAG: DUF5668 domain-containing protein [Patescibacteria group bacterium]|jgi:hypothetical protein
MEEKNEAKKSEPNVHVFGEEVYSGKNRKGCCGSHQNHDYNGCCRRGDPGVGVAILFAGIILLLNTLGVIPWEIWNYIWVFWPALLILAGIKILLGHAPGAGALLFLASLAVYGFIIIYGLIHVQSSLLGGLPAGLINFVQNFNLNFNN